MISLNNFFQQITMTKVVAFVLLYSLSILDISSGQVSGSCDLGPRLYCYCSYVESVGRYSVDCSGLRFNGFPIGTLEIVNPGGRDVYRISFRDSGVTDIFENAFDAMPNLFSLDLRNNQITTFPANALKSLTLVQEMDVAYNRLTEIPNGALDHMTSLRDFDGRGNRLITVGETAFAGQSTSLQEIDLAYNQLPGIPDALKSLSALQILDLSYNTFSPSSLPSGIFNNMNALTSLNLQRTLILNIDPQAYVGLESSVDRIVVANNNLTTLERCTFEKLTALTTLWVDSNPFVCGCELAWLERFFASWPVWRQARCRPVSGGSEVNITDFVFQNCSGYQPPACP
ncbi:unnamed protein product [Owenia fusiformis]|uniref:Uncharacterized protein n=1 Tax=Owenia fusiformis TaxID=6347 RepID=A0A8S4P825_OWEFU|nr:unnamed protein product [Owenia fusiformis]